MLSVEKIKELNEMMIGRGVPDVKDYSGYNKPDYGRMYIIGMLNSTYTPEECFVVLETLQKYKNTQLSNVPDLEETYEAYKDAFYKTYKDAYNRENAIEMAKIGASRNHSDFQPSELIYFGSQDKDKVFLFKFKEYIASYIPNKVGAKWTRNDNNEFCIAVPSDRTKEFFDSVRFVGKTGYVPSEDAIKDIKEKQEEWEALKTPDNTQDNTPVTDKADNKPVTIEYHMKDTGLVNEYGHHLFEITPQTFSMKENLWLQKNKCLSYVDTKDSTKMVVSVKPEHIEGFISYCRANEIECKEACENLQKQKEAELNKNKSGNTLIDVTKLDLPFTPYAFQTEDAKEILAKKKALIGHDMGCGKTFISTLVGMSINIPKLVVCPESLRLNWVRELERTDKGADISLVYSKDKDIRFGDDWTVMGYHTATKFMPQILAKGIQCMFIDEAHNAKAVNNYGEPSSKRAAALMKLAESMKYTYLLTGTPMPTRNKDLYNILVMLGEVDPDEKYAFHTFGKQFCNAYNTGYGWDYSGSSSTGELHDILSKYMTRRLKSDVLPNLKKQRQFIPLEEISKEYKNIESRLYDMNDDDTYMGLAMSGRRVLSDVKVKPTIDLAETFVNSDESVVIVTEFNETMDKFIDKFGDNACYIRGGMSDKAKQQAIDDFQSGRKKVCVLNLIAGGVGITLTKAHNMIICDYDWTPANMTQVEDRICRTGQTECCNIYYMYCENALLDRIFVNMITDKSANIDQVVDNAENTVDLASAKNENSSYLDILKSEIAKNGGQKPSSKKVKTPKAPKETKNINKGE